MTADEFRDAVEPVFPGFARSKMFPRKEYWAMGYEPEREYWVMEMCAEPLHGGATFVVSWLAPHPEFPKEAPLWSVNGGGTYSRSLAEAKEGELKKLAHVIEEARKSQLVLLQLSSKEYL